MKETVLITAIGTVTATAIVKELKKTDQFYLIGADINQQNEIATSLDVDEYHVFPPVADADVYLEFVLDFCKKHKVNFYYAVLDKEVVNISANRNKFTEIGTKLCVVNYEFAKICHFKNEFSDWVQINAPELAITTYTYDEITSDKFPIFVKPVEGVASSGCRCIYSMDEFHSSVTREQVNTKVLVQEYVSGDNITVDLIRNRQTGQKTQIQRKELLRNANGCGIAVEIIEDSKLTEICDFLMEKLDLNGVANAEFFFSNGDYKIIEINPRFSAGSLYSCMAGVNTVINACRIAEGKPCVFGDILVGKNFAERYEVYQMN